MSAYATYMSPPQVAATHPMAPQMQPGVAAYPAVFQFPGWQQPQWLPAGVAAMQVSSMIPVQPRPPATLEDAMPVGSIPDDEEILVRALRGCRAKGLTARQALERLHNVSFVPP